MSMGDLLHALLEPVGIFAAQERRQSGQVAVGRPVPKNFLVARGS